MNNETQTKTAPLTAQEQYAAACRLMDKLPAEYARQLKEACRQALVKLASKIESETPPDNFQVGIGLSEDNEVWLTGVLLCGEQVLRKDIPIMRFDIQRVPPDSSEEVPPAWAVGQCRAEVSKELLQ
jgi:hypothetical protein